jgi:hypothetical protein
MWQEVRVSKYGVTKYGITVTKYGLTKYSLSVFSLAVVAIAVTLACGSSAYMLQTVKLSPASADAQGNPVQFAATGYFNQQPSPVQLVSVNWGACYQNQRTTAVSVSTGGVAQCAAGAVGTYTVWAWAERTGLCGGNNGEDPVNFCGGAGECQVTGTAQLTCRSVLGKNFLRQSQRTFRSKI